MSAAMREIRIELFVPGIIRRFAGCPSLRLQRGTRPRLNSSLASASPTHAMRQQELEQADG